MVDLIHLIKIRNTIATISETGDLRILDLTYPLTKDSFQTYGFTSTNEIKLTYNQLLFSMDKGKEINGDGIAQRDNLFITKIVELEDGDIYKSELSLNNYDNILSLEVLGNPDILISYTEYEITGTIYEKEIVLSNYSFDFMDIHNERDNNPDIVVQFNNASYQLKDQFQLLSYSINETKPVIQVEYLFDGKDKSTIYISRDDGVNWLKIKEDALTDISNQPEGNNLRVKVVLEDGQELHGLSYAWL